MTNAIPSNLLALLDRITDPTHNALVDLREAVTELGREVATLKTAIDKDGVDDKKWLAYLVERVEDALDDLVEAVEP